MTRLPLSQLTLDAVQAAAIRTAHLHPEAEPDVSALLVQLAKVAEAAPVLLDARETDPLVTGLLNLAALALRWVEEIEGASAS